MTLQNAFPKLTPDDLKRLTDYAYTVRLTGRQTLIQEGSRERALFVIKKGKVDVVRRQGENWVRLAQLGQDDVLGEMTFIDNAPASATVVAVEDTEVMCIDGYKLGELIRDIPDFYGRFYQSLAVTLVARLRLMNDRKAKVAAEQAAAERAQATAATQAPPTA